MSMRTCAILLWRIDSDMDIEDPGETACLRLAPHWTGPHVFRRKDGRYFAWEDDDACGCCKPEEIDRCFIYWELSAQEAKEIIEKRDY